MRQLRIALLGALVVGAGALAAPVKVTTIGTKGQAVAMCPDCKAKVACAAVGDYTIGFGADIHPKHPTGTFVVHLMDKAKKPVADAKVAVTLSMPKHGHAVKLPLKHKAHGMYVASSSKAGMPGAWRAEVAATLAGGDTVKQVFTYQR